jgi:hypothetical protein
VVTETDKFITGVNLSAFVTKNVFILPHFEANYTKKTPGLSFSQESFFAFKPLILLA